MGGCSLGEHRDSAMLTEQGLVEQLGKIGSSDPAASLQHPMSRRSTTPPSLYLLGIPGVLKDIPKGAGSTEGGKLGR